MRTLIIISLLLVLAAAPVHAARMIVVVKATHDLAFLDEPHASHACGICNSQTPIRVYCIGGTIEELQAIGSMTGVIPITGWYRDGGATWVLNKLDDPLPTVIRNRANTWLANNGYTYQIPVDATGRQVIRKIARKFWPGWKVTMGYCRDHGD